MITLYGWGPMFDCPSPSPFVMKTDIQMQMLGVTFDRAIANLEAVSKHKAPYVMDGEVLIQDSNFIRAHFEKKLHKSLDAGLTDEQRAASWALERMAEDHLAAVMRMERWLKDENFYKGPVHFFDGMPEPALSEMVAGLREGMAATQYAIGIGRHTEAERMQLAEWDLQAIAIQLGAKPFLFGDTPKAADASVASVLISCATEFFDTPLTDLVRGHTNLVGYMDRMKATYFARTVWPATEMA